IVGEVAEDLFAAGQQVDVIEGATVGQDAYLAGEIITINGTISGTLRAAGSTITLGEHAVIEGDLISYGSKPTLAEGATVLGSQEHRADQKVTRHEGNPLSGWVRATLTTLIVVLLITLLMPKTAQMLLEQVKENRARNVITGAVWLLLVIPVGLILAVTIIGLPIALTLVGVTVVAYILATGLAALFIGQWVYAKLSPEAAKQPLSWIAAVIGAAIYQGIQMFGFPGALAILIIVLFMFGTVIQTIWRSRI
ncbi:MAG: polymer-forming cytoskeletal protein, partial [Candidatus Andersenbacteria bacterium]